SGENAADGPWVSTGPSKSQTGLPDGSSHSRGPMVVPRTYRPPGAKTGRMLRATPRGSFSSPSSTPRDSRPEATSHWHSQPSVPADHSVLPSAAKDSADTAAWCPVSGVSTSPSGNLQTHAACPCTPQASGAPLGGNTIPCRRQWGAAQTP